MIRIVVDDLAFLAVDAVLRPTNEALDPITPALTRLDRAAGETFQRQRRVQTLLDAGAAVVTGAGDLAADFVVHVVIQTSTKNADAATIRRGLLSAWQRAHDWQLGSMATPLVGTGAGQLSLEDAAGLIATTWHERGMATAYPTDLQIVLEREEDRAAVEAVIQRHAP